MITPTWEGLFEAVDELVLPERSYPYSYQDLPLIKLFVYARNQRHHRVSKLAKALEAASRGAGIGGIGKSAPSENAGGEV